MIVLLLALVSGAFAAGDGEEISRSRGRRGGVVVLWPRVVRSVDAPADPAMDVLAGQLQQRLAASVSRIAPGVVAEVRPRPERVCPQEGCRAVSVGLMLGEQGGGCALVATVSAPGPSSQRLVPLAGDVVLASPTAAFRQAPEQLVTVSELAPCAEIVAALDLAPLEAALSEVLAASVASAPR